MDDKIETADGSAPAPSRVPRGVLLLGGVLAVVVASGWVEANSGSYASLYAEMFGTKPAGCAAAGGGCCHLDTSSPGCCHGGEAEDTIAWQMRTPLEAPRPPVELVRIDETEPSVLTGETL